MRASASVMVLVALAGCARQGKRHPWLDPDASDAEDWGRTCAPYHKRAFEDPKVPSNSEGFLWLTPFTPGLHTNTRCVLYRDKRTARLVALEVSVDWRDAGQIEIALASIDHLRALLLAEVAPEYRPWVLWRSLAADRGERGRLVGPYYVDGGFADDRRRWYLYVYADTPYQPPASR